MTTEHRATSCSTFLYFFLIITFCIPVFIFHGKELFPECAINPILFHFSSFLFLSLSVSRARFITIVIAPHCLQGEGRQIVSAGMRAEEAHFQ